MFNMLTGAAGRMELHFRKATGVFAKTLPWILLRLGLAILFGLLAVAFIGGVGWVAYTLWDAGTISGPIVIVALAIATILFLAFLKWVRRYALYLVSAGHIAVVAHIVETGEVPANQLSFGKDKVTDNFVEASALWGLDRILKGVLKQFNGAMLSVADLVSFIPALKTVVEIISRAIRMAGNYLDEAIMAHIFLNEEKDNWTAARDGVVLYGKTWKPVLASTVIIVLLGYVVSFVGLLALSPVAAVLSNLQPVFEILGWIVAGALGLTLYIGLLRPWIKTVVITTYLEAARDETPDSETADWIAEHSARFRDDLLNRVDMDRSEERTPSDRPAGGDVAGTD